MKKATAFFAGLLLVTCNSHAASELQESGYVRVDYQIQSSDGGTTYKGSSVCMVGAECINANTSNTSYLAEGPIPQGRPNGKSTEYKTPYKTLTTGLTQKFYISHSSDGHYSFQTDYSLAELTKMETANSNGILIELPEVVQSETSSTFVINALSGVHGPYIVKFPSFTKKGNGTKVSKFNVTYKISAI